MFYFRPLKNSVGLFCAVCEVELKGGDAYGNVRT
jgi:hypothetical protein